MKKKAVLSLLVFCATVGITTAYRAVRASDHDDGETDKKARALNLTDHYVWKDTTDPTKLDFVQGVNPRSLPGYQYFYSSNALYDIHVSRASSKTAAPTGSDDVVFRFQFGAPSTANIQSVTLTVLNSGNSVGSDATGSTTPINTTSPTLNTVTINGVSYKYFVGTRQDTFFFDVHRYFAVRNFLAQAFFGGVAATTPLNTFQTGSPTCDGSFFLKGIASYDTTGGPGGAVTATDNGDKIHLFNPPSCAQDFTRNYNRLEIELQAPISSLQANGETVFDSWSTIETPQ